MNDEQRYIYDLIAASAERTVKRLWIVIIILIMALCSSNACWIWYESQYSDTVTTTTIEAEQDGGGNNTVVGGDYEPTSEGYTDNKK